MRKIYLIALAISLIAGYTAKAQHAFLNQAVLDKLDTANENELIPIFLSFEDRVDVSQLKAELKANQTSIDKRAQVVMHRLKSKANETQPQVVAVIENAGLSYDKLQRFWISNVIAIEAVPALVHLLSENEAIDQITYNPAIFSLEEPIRGTPGAAPKSVGGIEPGLEAIGASAMWAMGYTGHGRIAMTFDSGVNPEHPAHSERFLANLMPLEATWFPYDQETPGDKSGSHGTHVTGTMLGLDPETADTIGVAPQAYFIATDPIVSNLADVRPFSEYMLAYEWALNPDGDENTSDDIPDIINNSWGQQVIGELFDGWFYCDDLLATTFDALLAAGIANVTSVGNLGPAVESVGVPSDINTSLVNTFTVGAVGSSGSFPVADFSSRGPSLCDGEGSLLIKPEVSAPGVNVRSSVGTDGYDMFSGTSMASPHVSGAILLLKEAFPQVTGEELELALYYSATDLGTPGEDNTYGMGIINLPSAFAYLSETYDPTPPQNLVNDLAIVSIDEPLQELGCGTDVTPIISVKNLGLNAIDSYTIRYDINGQNENELAISESIGTNETIQITLPSIAYSGSGLMELHIWIDEITDEYDLFNNHRTTRWHQIPSMDAGNEILFGEDFSEGIDENIWNISNPDGDITWESMDVLQIDGTMGLAAWVNHPEYTAIESQKDGLITPFLTNLGTDEFYNLTFDLYYRKRGSSSFTQDTMAIYFNDGCTNLQEIWRAGGSELWTNDDAQQNAFPESADEWTTISIDLPDPTMSSFYINFESINRRGNNMLIDNILISSSLSTNNVAPIDFEMYPNPVKNLVTIKPNSIQNATAIEVRDISGRSLLRLQESKTQYSIDFETFASGVYMVTISYESGQKQTQKLIVE